MINERLLYSNILIQVCINPTLMEIIIQSFIHVYALDMLYWQLVVELWITRRLGESILEEKYWDFSSNFLVK